MTFQSFSLLPVDYFSSFLKLCLNFTLIVFSSVLFSHLFKSGSIHKIKRRIETRFTFGLTGSLGDNRRWPITRADTGARVHEPHVTPESYIDILFSWNRDKSPRSLPRRVVSSRYHVWVTISRDRCSSRSFHRLIFNKARFFVLINSTCRSKLLK